MLRVVIDTVVFVRALINPRNRCGRLFSEHSSRFQMVVSEPIVREVLEVLRRPELAVKYRGLGEMNIRRIIDLVSQAESVPVTEVPAVGRDLKDDIFVATALAGRADYLVSEDNDLLVLGDTLGIPIVDAKTFMGLFEPGP
jgi:uncharacterized protein